MRLVTPISSSIARPLIDGLKNEVVVWDHSATRMFEEITPRSYQQAVGEALQSQVEQLERPSPSAPDVEPAPGSLDGIFCDRHWVACSAPPERLEAVVASIGGDAHWYPLRWAWRLRARFDDLFGGAGLTWRRPEEGLHRGSKVDWWTVEEVTHDRLLLRADMRVPGEAWLEWRVNPVGARCELRQSAYFRPKGLLGLMYWYGLYAFHQPIFKLMAVRLARRAETPRAPRGWATWWWWTAQRRSGHDAQRSAKAHDVGSN